MSTPVVSFQVGDVVRLAGGGPKMTITALPYGERMCRCEWFVGTTPYRHLFCIDVLEIVAH